MSFFLARVVSMSTIKKLITKQWFVLKVLVNNREGNVTSQHVTVSKSPPKGDANFVVAIVDVHHTLDSDHNDSLEDMPSLVDVALVA